MKKTTKILFFILIISLVSLSAVFAEAMKETKRSIDFSTLDLETSDAKDIMDGFEQYRDTFSTYKEKLIENINKAYIENDSSSYFTLRNELRNLKSPRLSEEDTQKIVTNIQKNNDYDLAMWLYKNSPFYRPSIKCSYSASGTSFSSSVSEIPGTDVTIPDFKLVTSGKVFTGWQAEDGTVYKAGDVIKMPLEGLNLTAILEKDPNCVEGRNVLVEGLEDLHVTSNSQQQIKFTLKNNGTEDLENLKLNFSSDDPYLYVLFENLNSSYFRCGSTMTASFPVMTKAPSGTSLTAKLNISDSQGDSWSYDLVITVD